jgi:hypothetical protein
MDKTFPCNDPKRNQYSYENVTATIATFNNKAITRDCKTFIEMWDTKWNIDPERSANAKFDEYYGNYNGIANSVASHMARVFEQKKSAKEWESAVLNKTGKIDTDSLFKYKIHDDIFTRKYISRTGKKHCLIVYCDLSGSMRDCFSSVMNQAGVFARFARYVKIPFKIIGFYTDDYSNSNKHNVPNVSGGIIKTQSYQAREFCNSELNTQISRGTKILFLWLYILDV